MKLKILVILLTGFVGFTVHAANISLSAGESYQARSGEMIYCAANAQPVLPTCTVYDQPIHICNRDDMIHGCTITCSPGQTPKCVPGYANFGSCHLENGSCDCH